MSRGLAKRSEVEPITEETEAEGRGADRPERPQKPEVKGLRTSRIIAFFRDLREEVRKVAWPSWTDARRASLAVLRILVASMIILETVDLITTFLFRIVGF
ncbi:MAG: preprotein translocase subunit SecE [bacterium]